MASFVETRSFGVGRTYICYNVAMVGKKPSSSRANPFAFKKSMEENPLLMAIKPSGQKALPKPKKQNTRRERLRMCPSQRLTVLAQAHISSAIFFIRKGEFGSAERHLQIAFRAISVARRIEGKSALKAYDWNLRGFKAREKTDGRAVAAYEEASSLYSAIACAKVKALAPTKSEEMKTMPSERQEKLAEEIISDSLASLHFNNRNAASYFYLFRAMSVLGKDEIALISAISNAIRLANPSDKRIMLVARGNRLTCSLKFEAALSDFRKAELLGLDISSLGLSIYSSYGLCHVEAGDMHEAIRIFNKALSMEPKKGESGFNAFATMALATFAMRDKGYGADAETIFSLARKQWSSLPSQGK